MFVDEANIVVKSGDGGNGAISFRREKFIVNGGPDGGDGGAGGDIVFKVDTNLNTLMNFKNKKRFFAKNGENGLSSKRRGKSADPLIILVPKGTLIRERESNSLLYDMNKEGDFIFLKGGKGGVGNYHFKSSLNRSPKIAIKGKKGIEINIKLELKLLSDVAIIGFPNAGKSTLLNRVANANSKVANYPFSTLTPKLGIAKLYDSYITLSDIPGLIEGASQGKGLGFQFLRHIERSKFLWHLIDLSEEDLIGNFTKLNGELAAYSGKLSKRKQLIVGTKLDAEIDEKSLKTFEEYLKKNRHNYIFISSLQSLNIEELLKKTMGYLKENKEEEELEDTVSLEKFIASKEKKDFEIEISKQGEYVVSGRIVEQIEGKYLFSEEDGGLNYIKMLRKLGLEKRLLECGIKNGDVVEILGMKFEFKE